MNGKAIDAAMLLLKNGGGGASAEVRRELDLLWKLTRGTVWDTQTDAQEAYTKTVPSGAVAAEVGSIGGKTVLWNQVVNDGDFGSADKWAGNRFRIDSVSDGVIQFTAVSSEDLRYLYQRSSYDRRLESGHKYYAHMEAKTNAADPATLQIRTYSTSSTGGTMAARNVGNDWTVVEGIYTQGTAPDYNFVPAIRSTTRAISEGTVCYARRFFVVDLTRLLGAGNEPDSTADPVIAAIRAYAAENPAYSAGELLSASVTEIVSKDSDAETLGSMEIPAAVRALEGYGQSAVGGSGNTLNLADGTYTEIGHYVDGVWTLLDTPVVTDVSGYLPDNMLDVEAGGTLTFVQEGGTELEVPNSVEYLIKLSEVTE